MNRISGKTTSRTGRSGSVQPSGLSPDARQHMIGEAAYFRFVQRGFDPGHELDDWLAAEAEFEQTSLSLQPPGADMSDSETIEEFGMQHGGTLGPAVDEALKRVIKRHPGRDIPRIESMEPQAAPPKE